MDTFTAILLFLSVLTYLLHFADFSFFNKDTYNDNNHDISDIPKKNLRHTLFLSYLITIIPMLIFLINRYHDDKIKLITICIIFVYLALVFISDAYINGMFTFGKEDKIDNNLIRKINLYGLAVTMTILATATLIILHFFKKSDSENLEQQPLLELDDYKYDHERWKQQEEDMLGKDL